MIQQKQFVGGLLALGISIALQASASVVTDAPPTTLLMSEAEVNAHTAAMAKLEGQAREDYRNAQYEQLKKRAREQGFELPEKPPWTTAATPPPKAAGGEDAAAAARHAEMREKLQARREAMQQASEANLARLQEAAKAQQQQVDVQLQAERQRPAQDTPKPAADVPPVPVTAAVPAAPAPILMPEPATAAVTEPPARPVPVKPPAPPTPPAPPSPPAKATTAADRMPHFAPVEQIAAPEPPPAQTVAAGETGNSSPEAVAAGQSSDAMAAYRENMRTRFDEYMQERQMQMEENARRQREQHEAAMEKNRALRANRGPYAPYPYPAAPPSYGPRYPAAYPGYRTPYWQQQ